MAGVIAHPGELGDDHRDPFQVHRSVSNPFARPPWSSACSTLASWAADSLGSGPVGPRLRKALPRLLEAGVPDLGALARHAEFVGDLGLGAALGE
jgi:hypothetical protein